LLNNLLDLAGGLIFFSLVFEPLIIRYNANCFLDASFNLVTCSTTHCSVLLLLITESAWLTE